MPVYYIRSDAVVGDRIRLEGALAKHLRDVLRVRTGEHLTLVDEARASYRARVERVGRSTLDAVIEDRRPPGPPDHPQIVLGQALIKGERMDWVIQKATELGVARIVPLVTERTVIRLADERSERRVDRFRTIAREAAQQSCRPAPPEIGRITPLPDFLRSVPTSHLPLFLYEHERSRGLKEALRSRTGSSALLAVGPEGGFTPDEAGAADKEGWVLASLGPRILRTETAALAALFAVQFEWDGFAPSVGGVREWENGTR